MAFALSSGERKIESLALAFYLIKLRKISSWPKKKGNQVNWNLWLGFKYIMHGVWSMLSRPIRIIFFTMLQIESFSTQSPFIATAANVTFFFLIYENVLPLPIIPALENWLEGVPCDDNFQFEIMKIHFVWSQRRNSSPYVLNPFIWSITFF